METTAKPKRWGNSIGVIIPKEIVEKEGITLKDELVITVEIKKKIDRKHLMKEGYLEMKEDIESINKEWENADFNE